MEDSIKAERKKMSVEEFIPRVSVLIPSYRSGKMLFEALESVMRQDYPMLEIVICDDGSESFEEKPLRELAQSAHFAELKIVCRQKNVGTVRNLNSGLRLCTGKWVLPLAADDVLAAKNVVFRLVEQAEKSKQDWVLGRTAMCNRKLERTGKVCPSDEQIGWAETPQKLYSALCRDCFLPASGNLYRMEFMNQMGFFDEHYRLVEDWPLFLKAARAGILPEMCDAITVLHRSNGVSQNDAGRNQIYQRDLIKTMEREILPYLNHFSTDERMEVERLCQDKQAIYQFRFLTRSIPSRLHWISTHLDVLFRKIIGGLGERLW